MWAIVLFALGFLAMACWRVDSLAFESPAIESIDRPWIAAAWILILQAGWQLLPLPQSLGRVGWAILIGWLAPIHASLEDRWKADDHWRPKANSIVGSHSNSRDESSRDESSRDDSSARFNRPPLDAWAIAAVSARRVRWWLVGLAFMVLITGVIAIQATGFASESGGQPFPIFAGIVLLSLWLFASSRSEDLFAIQAILAEQGEIGQLHGKMGARPMWQRWRERRTELAHTTRLRAAAAREQAEASDASRVDEILQRMHKSGPDSLTNEERELLQRVSEAIRRQRERDNL
jgi:hypothetical protein